MIHEAPSMLGRGVYGLPEVALYTELNDARVRSWFTTRLRPGRLFQGDYPIVDNHYGVSFLDLIDVLVAGRLRGSGVSMRKVRAVYEKLKEQLDTEHPFCHNRFFTDGSEIIIEAADALGDQMLAEVISRQQLYVQAKSFLLRVDYSDQTQLAERWRIVNGVTIDPQVSFGKPVVEDNRSGTATSPSRSTSAMQEPGMKVTGLHTAATSHPGFAKNTESLAWSTVPSLQNLNT